MAKFKGEPEFNHDNWISFRFKSINDVNLTPLQSTARVRISANSIYQIVDSVALSVSDRLLPSSRWCTLGLL